MPSARTVVLYTLLWARPERLGAGFSCGGRKMALTAPGPLMAAPACRPGACGAGGVQACFPSPGGRAYAGVEGVGKRASQRWPDLRAPQAVCCVRFFVLRLLHKLLLVTVVS